MNREVEVKIELIGLESYRKVLSHLGEPQEKLKQENIYYDSKGCFLKKQGSVLRLRNENGNFIYTYKSNAVFQHMVMNAEESELEIPECELAQKGIEKIYEQLSGQRLPDAVRLQESGRIQNLRFVYDFYGAFLELDCFTIFDKTYFEIELETKNPTFYKKKIENMLRQLRIDFQPSMSKYARYLSLSKGRLV